MLLPVILMSVLSLLTLQTSYGEHLAEESCTVQILVPGLKGMLSPYTQQTKREKKKLSSHFLIFFPLFFLRRTRRERSKRSTGKTRKSWPSWRDWCSFFNLQLPKILVALRSRKPTHLLTNTKQKINGAKITLLELIMCCYITARPYRDG